MRLKSYVGILTASIGIAMAAMLTVPQSCAAEVVTGRGYIQNGDKDAARRQALQDAERNLVEMRVGVKVSSETSVSMGAVVYDNISSQSNGFVKINNILKEWTEGNDIYCIEADMTASESLIDTAIGDVQKAMESLDQSSNRYGIVVAVTGRDENGRPVPAMDLQRFVTQYLQEKGGFYTLANDEVNRLLDGAASLNDPDLNARIRVVARNMDNRNEANALLRGVLSTVEVHRAGREFVAAAQASLELLGLDSPANNAFSEYAYGFGNTVIEASENAKKKAVQKAVMSLAQQALKTEQRDMRGGVRHTKVTMFISGIVDRQAQPLAIRQALSSMGMRIIRSNFNSRGQYVLFVDAMGDGGRQGMLDKLAANMPQLVLDNSPDADDMSKVYLRFQ